MIAARGGCGSAKKPEIAAAVAFATGTSWGTMGILVPLAIPLV